MENTSRCFEGETYLEVISQYPSFSCPAMSHETIRPSSLPAI